MSDDNDLSKRVTILESRLNTFDTVLERLEKQNQELERENAELRRQVADLKSHVDPDPGRKDYDQLTRADKVRRIREQLVDIAESNHNGRAAMKYKEVMMLFDGCPSAGHCYDLMQRAGQIDGFEYDENGDGQKRTRVDIEAVKDESLFHAVNKAVEA